MSDTVQLQINHALHERDQMWRIHEKEQIEFLQNQNAQLLTHLHLEIERLVGINRDLSRRLNVGDDDDDKEVIEELQKKIEKREQENEELTKDLVHCQEKCASLEKVLERTINHYKDELQCHEDRIKQLTAEMHDRTQTVAQLSTQLRSIKLREAMAQAQQRRRASCNSPMTPGSPQEGPNESATASALRLFGFYKDNKAVGHQKGRAVSLRQPIWSDPIENNIEKAKTLSTSFTTARPRHLSTIRRIGSASGEPL